jgi:hypothetical protein
LCRSGLAIKETADSADGKSGDLSGAQADIFVVSSEKAWNDLCPPDYKGICVVAFLSAPAGASSSEAYSLDHASVAVAQDVLKNMSKTSGGTFRFLVGNIACLGTFAQDLGVDPFNVPTVAVYSPSKSRHAVFKGSYNSVSFVFSKIIN